MNYELRITKPDANPIAIGILLETGVPKAFGITVFKGKNKGKRSRPNSEVII